jgi:dihydrofolate reductase
MGKLRLNITMSLDGFVAGPNQSEENPLGEGGGQLHQWLYPLAIFRETHGEEGGEVSPSTAVVEEWLDNIGATVMGRNMFGGGPGPWREDPWNGWWGEEPPFHGSVFVVTHHPREPLTLSDTTFTFVTEGVESAVAQAKGTAGGKDVSLAGGADVARQCLAAGLVDEMDISLVPLLLGDGARLLDDLRDAGLELEQLRTVDAPGVTHIKYGVTRATR